jgi:hypothetical protein
MKSDIDSEIEAASLKFGQKRPSVPAENSAPSAKLRRVEVFACICKCCDATFTMVYFAKKWVRLMLDIILH